MTDLEDMRSFVEVVETGGFSRAADRLGVSKSIVSRRISRLEADLGVQLLARSTRGISATEAGTEFKARAERILAEVEDARDAVREHGGGLSGRLRIAAPFSFGVRHVAPLLADIARENPRLDIDVAYSDHTVDLIGEGFDVAIRIGTLRDSSLIARTIAPVHSAIVASPAYLAANGAPETPDEVSSHECLLYSGTASSEWRFKAPGRHWKAVSPRGRLRSDSGEAILQWAIDGLGLAAMPTFLCSAAIRAGALRPILTDHPMPESALHVVRPPGPHVPRKVRLLTDAAVRRFSNDADWDPCRLAVAQRAGPKVDAG